MFVIVADVGGTWSRCQLVHVQPQRERVLFQRHYPNAASSGLLLVLKQFQAEADTSDEIEHLVLAVAGPVFGRRCSMTNRPWQVDADELSAALSIPQVHLLNDLHAAALGLQLLETSDKLTLQSQGVALTGPSLLIGAGSGLGQAMLVDRPGLPEVFQSEAGFAGFAPESDFSMALLRHAKQQQSYVCNETFLSASGLSLVYQYLLERDGESSAGLLQPQLVTRMAAQGDARAAEAVQRFVTLLGSYCGNAALSTLASSGVYLMGGAALSTLADTGAADFLAAFNTKGRMSGYMKNIPVTLVTNDGVGMMGALAWLRNRIAVEVNT